MGGRNIRNIKKVRGEESKKSEERRGEYTCEKIRRDERKTQKREQ